MQGNENISTKAQVLKALRQSDNAISGEELALSLGVSRTSVWKAIQALQNSGYKIDAQKNGYSLLQNNCDSIMPFEFGKNESLHAHFEKVGSTMDEARKIALDGMKDARQEKIVSADEQSAGRGRGNHLWKTTSGSLAFTIVTYPQILSHLSCRLLAAAQIALAQALEKCSGKKFYVRWPNDIWSEKGKVAGILDESLSCGGLCAFLNLGIGVNVSRCPKIPGVDKVFDKPRPFARKEILEAFVQEFSKAKEEALLHTSGLQRHWNKLNYDNQKTVRVAGMGEFIFDGIDSAGWALMRPTNNGAQKRFAPGSASYEKR